MSTARFVASRGGDFHAANHMPHAAYRHRLRFRLRRKQSCRGIQKSQYKKCCVERITLNHPGSMRPAHTADSIQQQQNGWRNHPKFRFISMQQVGLAEPTDI